MTENEILQYLKSMKFKKALFGVDETDVYYQIRTLNYMYKELLSDYKDGAFDGEKYDYDDGGEEVNAQIDNSFVRPPETKIERMTDEEYKEKVDAVAKAFVEMQSQSDSIISTAKGKADRIIREAELKADDIIAEAEVKSRRLLESGLKTILDEEKKRKERVRKLEQEKAETLEYLTEVRDIVNTLVPGCLAESRKKTASIMRDTSSTADIA